jgi:hypothetical protein
LNVEEGCRIAPRITTTLKSPFAKGGLNERNP